MGNQRSSLSRPLHSLRGCSRALALREISRAHAAAFLGAAPAYLYAFIHFPQLLAAIGAGVADLRARGAYELMVSRIAQHEIGSRLANLGAVQHECEMLFFDMLAAKLQAMSRGHLPAGFVALTTSRDAVFGNGIGACHSDLRNWITRSHRSRRNRCKAHAHLRC